MKRLFLFCTILLSICAYSQDTSKLTAKVVYDDIKVGFKQGIGELKELASKLEGPAKYVYNTYVYQHKIEGVSYLFITIFFTILGFSILVANIKKSNWTDEGWNKSATLSIFGIIFSAVSLILICTFFGDDYFTKMLNPEYFAIKDIINGIK